MVALLLRAAAAACVCCAIPAAGAPCDPPPPSGPAARVERVADGVYAFAFPERAAADERLLPARAAFVVGPRGVVVVDSGIAARDGEALLEAIARTTRQPVRLAILTHPSQEAIFGAAALQARGIPVAMHRDAAALVAGRCEACLRNLRRALGEQAMAGTRLVVPDREIGDGTRIDDAGRELRVIAPPAASAPGAIALLDVRTGTLFAGSLVTPCRVPDLRDADARAWPAALARLQATRCRHLVPSYGTVSRCDAIPVFARYLADLEARVAGLLSQDVELAQVGERAALVSYSGWPGYAEHHAANAARTYLRLEREALAR